jgi:hypothetical protein
MDPTICLAIVIIIIIMWIWFTNYNHPICDEMWLIDVMKQLRTGDLILFKSETHWRSAIIGYYTHIGVVVQVENQLKIFEADLPNGKTHESQNKNGIHCHDLEQRLKKYHGRVYVRFAKDRNINLNMPAMQSFIEFCISEMKYNPNVFRNFVLKLMGDGYQKTTNCGELTLLSCVILGTIPKSYYNKHICHHLRFCCTELTEFYRDPIYIKIDPYDYC